MFVWETGERPRGVALLDVGAGTRGGGARGAIAGVLDRDDPADDGFIIRANGIDGTLGAT